MSTNAGWAEEKQTSASTDLKTSETAIFASGCFWGTEYMFQKAKGVLSTKVGYCGGTVGNPTYKQVCTGSTGHAEAIEVVFNPKVTSYEEMARLFFETHDPTHVDRQGPDIGEQYRSMIFYASDDQKKVAEKLIAELKAKGVKVATQLAPAARFWPAEDYHQNYYQKTGGRPYCHVYRKLF
ncbi:MAG: peptide-methionine (S)-S-oxide reductase MsrA [Candidatus Sumerlaeaceae bacterium]